MVGEKVNNNKKIIKKYNYSNILFEGTKILYISYVYNIVGEGGKNE
jgi:hypothetical protein